MSGAREPKPTWDDVPPALRAKIATIIGGEVHEARIVWGGFGPSATFILIAADGRRYFCKGTHPGQTPEGHAALKRERDNFQRFPQITQFGPRYLGGADEGDWHVALLEYLPRSREVPPWSDDAVAQVIALIARFHEASPPDAPAALNALDKAVGFNLFRAEQGWGSLMRTPEQQARFAALFESPAQARDWLTRSVEKLADLESRATAIGGPQSWLHLDIRSDNLVFGERGVKLVDWPFLAYGPTLVDVAFFLPGLAGEGGPTCAKGLALYERAAGTTFAPADVELAAAIVSGFFAARAGEPEVPVLPRLRWIQKLQLFPALDWVCEILEIAPPPAHRPLELV